MATFNIVLIAVCCWILLHAVVIISVMIYHNYKNEVKFELVFVWFDLWIGWFYDMSPEPLCWNRRLYGFFFPMLGYRISIRFSKVYFDIETQPPHNWGDNE